MLIKEFEGKTEEDALKQAMQTLNLDEADLNYEVSEETVKTGFFGFKTKRSIRIKVYYEEEGTKFAQEAKRHLRKLFELMNMDAQFLIMEESPEQLQINISSHDSGILIGKQGQTLQAIQFWINASMNNGQKGETKRIIVDVERYWNRRENSVQRSAIKLAQLVLANKKPRWLPLMNPFERRLVHIALQDFKDISTRSEGEGTYKKIRVFFKTKDLKNNENNNKASITR